MRKLPVRLLDASGTLSATTFLCGDGSWKTVTSGGGNLDSLSDVTVTSPATGQTIRWDGSAFVNAKLGIADITSLQTTLDGKAASSHTHDYAATSHTHPIADIAATGTKDATTFLRGDGTWAVPAGGTGGGGATTLDALTDVDTSTAPPTAGQVLAWDGAQWEPTDMRAVTLGESGEAPMDVEVVAQYTGNAGEGWTPSAAVREGDWVILTVGHGTGFTDPAGWTKIATSTGVSGYYGNTTRVFKKQVTAADLDAEPAITGSNPCSWAVQYLRNVVSIGTPIRSGGVRGGSYTVPATTAPFYSIVFGTSLTNQDINFPAPWVDAFKSYNGGGAGVVMVCEGVCNEAAAAATVACTDIDWAAYVMTIEPVMQTIQPAGLNDLADVDTTAPPADGDTLVYNGATGLWEPGTPPASGSGGGGLTSVDGALGTSVANATALQFTNLLALDQGNGLVKLTPPSPADMPEHAVYGDSMTSGMVDPKWTATGLTVTAGTDGYAFASGATGQRLVQPFTDTGQDFEVYAKFSGMATVEKASMSGLVFFTSTGAGIGFAPYNDGNTYNWHLGNYIYSSTGASLSYFNGGPDNAPYWLHVRRAAGTFSGRGSTDGQNWSNWNAGNGIAHVFTHIGIGRVYANGGAVSFTATYYNYTEGTFGL